MIQRPDQRQHCPGGLSQVDAGIGALVAGEIAALLQVLRLRAHGASKTADQRRKTFQRCGIAFGVQRQGGFTGGDVEQRLCDDIAGVDAFVDQMPGDPVLHLAVEQRPDRRVQPGIARQGAVVKVHRTPRRLCQQRLGNKVEIGDAEQPVKRQPGQIGAFGENPQTVAAGPAVNPGIRRHHTADPMAGVQQHLPAMPGQRRMADQQAGQRRHRGTSVRAVAGRTGPGRGRSACRSNERRKCGGSAGFLPVTRQRNRCKVPPAIWAAVARPA